MKRFCPARRRRAVTLLFAIIMLPLAMAIMMLLLTELQVRQYEMLRHEVRVQSRLLAESALALASTLKAPPAKPLDGTIQGAGHYRLESRPRADGTPAVVARGVSLFNGYQAVFEIEAAMKPGQPLTILETRQGAESKPILITGDPTRIDPDPTPEAAPGFRDGL